MALSNISYSDGLDLTPRSYQTAIVEQAKHENLIVCLPTGSGKTYIAVLLIKELSSSTLRKLQDGGKRTVILTHTVELAEQHKNTMTSLHLNVKAFCGSSKIKLNNERRWKEELEKCSILIFTAQYFLNILSHNLFSFNDINLLIVDECHHVTGNGPYATIMKDFYKPLESGVRILGLTASISGEKLESHELQKAARELERIYHGRIEFGDSNGEILQHSTSVIFQCIRCNNYENCLKKNISLKVTAIFKEVESLRKDLEVYFKTKNVIVTGMNEALNIDNQQNLIKIQCTSLNQLKTHLDNILHVGNELGLTGFLLSIKALANYLQRNTLSKILCGQTENELYKRIVDTLDSLSKKDPQDSIFTDEVRYSEKVVRLKELIETNKSGQSIIFVDRMHTAAFLCQTLNYLFNSSLKIEYLCGSKVQTDGICMSYTKQRSVCRKFRQKEIQVLISTSIVEEGFDIPQCNLVIRFNKPQNFSSFLQSKGRARDKRDQAKFVILRDEKSLEEFSKNTDEYSNYEHMEKKLRRGFKILFDEEENTSNEHENKSLIYEPGNGIKINGIRAIQIINQYCCILGHDQILSPRFCFYREKESNKFKCILTMPANCPIRNDITCESSNKKIAKQMCSLKMVKILHESRALDEKCVPIPRENYSDSDSDSETSDENTHKETSLELINNHISHFPLKHSQSSTTWYLYRINMLNNSDLGFVIPKELPKLPKFQLYEYDGPITVAIVYLKSIELNGYLDQLKIFTHYIFQQVLNYMMILSDSFLLFDFENSTFKLLPCFLDKFNNIDCERMSKIFQRQNEKVEDIQNLNDNELYQAIHPNDNELYKTVSGVAHTKHVTDKWTHKKLCETIETYADHFEYKINNIKIRRDRSMATMQSYEKPRKNYLKDYLTEKEKKKLDQPIIQRYFPIEILKYAPLNQKDYQLISKLPSVLVRLTQLNSIEQLRQLFANNIQSYSLSNLSDTFIVKFDDCIPHFIKSNPKNTLPLNDFDYNVIFRRTKELQPLPDLLFQSITRRSADENTDMENLEVLGDCFLKFASSTYFYYKYPEKGAGYLTPKKDRQVSNKNLYKLAKAKDLENYLYSNKITYAGNNRNWIPPGYRVNGDDKTIETFTKQKVKQKALADMTEAFIGAYLISTDYATTLNFMNWLGLDVIPLNEKNEMMTNPLIVHADQLEVDIEREVHRLYNDFQFNKVEEILRYNFKNKAYLIAALTHPSYCDNRVTLCYDRLEYLGDAILDFLIIRYIFIQHYEIVTPNKITDLRQDLSNNYRLASIMLQHGIDKYILHASPPLFYDIKNYCEEKADYDSQQSIFEQNMEEWADSTMPKAFADVFEALIAGVFLDSNCNLENAWKVVQLFLEEYLKRSVMNTNLNPIRKFMESGGKIIRESSDPNLNNYTVVVELPNGVQCESHAKSKRQAKYDACRKILRPS